MSEELEKLKAILSKKLPEDEVQTFMAEFTLASGQGAVAIAGDATEALIITGSQNIVGSNNQVVINQGTDPQELIEMLRSLLQQMPQVESKPQLSSEELQTATIAFLQDVQNRFMETRLFHTKQPVILKDQYIPIQVTLELHKRDVETLRGYWETEEELKRAYALKGSEQQAEEELKHQQVSWKEVKPKHQRIMVLADPGMGKSTLLRMEAGITAQDELKKLRGNQTTSEQAILPLFLRLSELAKRSEELIEAIPSLIQRDYPNTAPPLLTLLIEKLEQGKCLLLFDALDEVPKLERNRIELQEKLDRFLRNYPCRIICTSRVVGYDGNFLGDGQEVEIVPFQEAQIEEYVKTWFTNAAEHLSNRSVSAAELLRELRNKPQVRGLVQNPLLLSLICSLYQEKGLTLPARRTQVYGKALEYMLAKWSKEKREPRKGDEDWADLKQELLEEIAYQFSCEDTEVFSRRDLRRKIDQYLRDEEVPSEFEDITASDLLVELTEQDGILQKLNPDDDQYLFLHRTFQEYLTACYLKRAKDELELTKAHFWKYDWHETITLAAGLMKKPLPLLQAITDEKDDVFQTQLLLAGRCLAECEVAKLPLVMEITNRIYQFWLAYPEAEFIRSVVVTLGQTNPLFYEQLQTALDNDDSDIRRSGAAVLGRIGSDKAVEGLTAALDDENSNVRRSAAAALRRIGSDKAVEGLTAVLDDENSNVRRRAASALGRIGSDKAVEGLIIALNDKNSDVRGRAALALGRIGSDKAVEGLTAALDDENSDVRRSVAAALGEIGSSKAVEESITALDDENSDVRRSVAAALGEIGSSKAVEESITALNDKNSNVRGKAAAALGEIGSDKAVEVLITALNDKNSNVRRRAAAALEKINCSTCLAKLIQSPQIDIYRADIFSLAQSFAVRFHREELMFVPVYPERVQGSRIGDKGIQC